MSIWVEVLSYVITLFVGVVIGLLISIKMNRPKNIVSSEAPDNVED